MNFCIGTKEHTLGPYFATKTGLLATQPSREQTMTNGPHHRQHLPPWRIHLSKIIGFLLVGTVLLLPLAAQAASGTSFAAGNKEKPPGFPLQSISGDPFVEASPLVVGVICSDGILLLAAHTIFAESNPESFLLHRENPSPGDDPILDLPESYRGPFRIHPVDASGASAMVCAGWRTDGQYLADHLRSASESEDYVFGGGSHTSFLADRAALFLAQCAVSEQHRPLACAGLLASNRILWLVDATGAYAVRAHALGKGSDEMNEILRAKDWTQLECRAAKAELLQILTTTDDEKGQENSLKAKTGDMDPIPKGSRFEMAMVQFSSDSQTRTSTERKTRLKRLFASR